MDVDPCEICKEAGAISNEITGDAVSQTCRRCGAFTISGTAVGRLRKLTAAERAKLSSYIRTNNRFGSGPTISEAGMSVILSAPPPSLEDRANKLLLEIYRRHPALGKAFSLTPLPTELLAVSASESEQELKYILRFLGQDGEQLIRPAGTNQIEFTPKGHQRIYELQKIRVDSDQVFVAMWFGGDKRRCEMDALWSKGLSRAIAQAGYQPHRVDKGEFNGKIDDEIIRQIRRSRFLVADFTEQNRGVYYEAGFAEGLGIPIIQTCHASDIGDLHFDNRQINTIAWSSPDELSDKLQKRIEGTLGRGRLLTK